jgi:hypothetical protein
MSPFIRELNDELYLGNNIIKNKLEFESSIPKDVTNIIRNYGHVNIAKLFENLNIKEKSIHKEYEIPISISKLKSKFIIGNFIDYLIPKILQNNFPNKVKKFDLNVLHKHDNFPKKIYHEYVDDNNHWSNLLENIFFTSTFNLECPFIETYKDFLINSLFYKDLESGLIKLVEMFKPKVIQNHFNINFDTFKAEIDLLFDDILIEIKVSSNEVCCMHYLCQVFTYGYLLTKKEKKINKIVLYNVETGIINIIDTSTFDFKLFYEEFYLIK